MCEAPLIFGRGFLPAPHSLGFSPLTLRVLCGMRLVETRFLNDKKGFNRGQPAALIEIESQADYDTLLSNIVKSQYYDGDYFRTHSGYVAGKYVSHFLYLAEMVAALEPHSVLEVGCGRGDVLSFLARKSIQVTGVDFSVSVVDQVWPELRDRVHAGDLSATCDKLHAAQERFDVIVGFDIWEHLHPAQLDASISAAVRCGSDDALFLFVVPAFGNDPVFGERFPLEFAENRSEFENRVPFRYLLAEQTDPLIPASGHLIWAHTTWWHEAFESHGLKRVPALERRFHRAFDAMLPNSVRSFYIFRRDTTGAEARAEKILAQPYGLKALLAAHANYAKAQFIERELAGSWWKTRLVESLPPQLRHTLKTGRNALKQWF
jgi:SAM-dependent methyltransferase